MNLVRTLLQQRRPILRNRGWIPDLERAACSPVPQEQSLECRSLPVHARRGYLIHPPILQANNPRSGISSNIILSWAHSAALAVWVPPRVHRRPLVPADSSPPHIIPAAAVAAARAADGWLADCLHLFSLQFSCPSSITIGATLPDAAPELCLRSAPGASRPPFRPRCRRPPRRRLATSSWSSSSAKAHSSRPRKLPRGEQCHPASALPPQQPGLVED